MAFKSTKIRKKYNTPVLSVPPKIYIFAPAMFIEVLKSKLHRVTVTEANLDYIGSVTVDEDLMDAADLCENEKVDIYNYRNGERFHTYVIKGKRGSGII